MCHHIKENQTGSECDLIAEQSIQEFRKMIRVVVVFLGTDEMARKEGKKVKKFDTSGTKSLCAPLGNCEQVKKRKHKP